MDTQMAERVWPELLVSFAERIGGKIATFTNINLTANISYGRVPCCAVVISREQHFPHFD